MVTSDLLSTSEAARILGVASETLRSWTKQGKITGQATALGTLYDTEVVHALAARREAASIEKHRRASA